MKIYCFVFTVIFSFSSQPSRVSLESAIPEIMKLKFSTDILCCSADFCH
uniref:Uncharacterized protein n=1 Tax=Anguilla anguilla TaxID=7936 RepID=A0A0E9SCG3_ANGAN